MSEDNTKYESTHPCEGSSELNGNDASFRNANMRSAPREVQHKRIRGGTVPMPRKV